VIMLNWWMFYNSESHSQRLSMVRMDGVKEIHSTEWWVKYRTVNIYFTVMWLERPNKKLARVGSVTGIQSACIDIKISLVILNPNVKIMHHHTSSSNCAIMQTNFLCWYQYILHKLTISSYHYLHQVGNTKLVKRQQNMPTRITYCNLKSSIFWKIYTN
jgi:hypothetical protein